MPRAQRRPAVAIDRCADGKGAVLFCHAGCSHIAVLDALGLKQCDLFDNPRMQTAYKDNATSDSRSLSPTPPVRGQPNRPRST
jgi:hypothetical protein